MTQVVVLDDWQDVARSHGPWERLDGRCTVRFLHTHLTDVDALVGELADAEVVVAMRERTPFPAQVLERLPALRLLVTTGMANASIDIDMAKAQGITVSGTSMYAPPTAELTWGLILASIKHIPFEHQAVAEGQWQTTLGGDLAEQPPRGHRPGSARLPRRPGGLSHSPWTSWPGATT